MKGLISSIILSKTRLLFFIAIFYGFFIYSGCGSAATLGSSITSISSEIDESENVLDEIHNRGLNISGPIWLLQRYNITCCLGGTPEISNTKYAKNLTSNILEYIIDENGDDITANCRNFNGKFYISPTHFFENNIISRKNLVICKCPNVGKSSILDKHCRILPNCKNKGYRTSTGLKKCICPKPFFGELCENICDQGQIIKDPITGNNYCNCIPFYQGDECKNILCLNGGKEDNGRCICPSQYLGYHCEIDTNKTGNIQNTRFQRYGEHNNNNHEMFTRDISGTIFSLIMIVVLVLSMYLLMKHRMQVQTRYLHRRPDLLGACNFPITPNPNQSCLSRRQPNDDPRVYPFRSINFSTNIDCAPPPYNQRSNNEVLPPLPTYEDATKMSNAISNNTDDNDVILNGQITPIQQQQQQVNRIIIRQQSSTSNDSSSDTTSNHGGRPCSVEYDSDNHAIIHQNQPETNSNNSNRNLSEQVNSNSEKELSRESIERKSL